MEGAHPTLTGHRTALSARSVLASTLLGTHPPRLRGRLLSAFAEQFGIAPGTTRVALSRMVERGELRNDDGVYELAGPLLERQERQARGLRPQLLAWDGTWELVIVPIDVPDAARAAAALGLAERRPGVWLRPSNLAAGRLPSSRELLDRVGDRFSAKPREDPAALAAELWDLARWSTEAAALEARMAVVVDLLDADDQGALVEGFELAAAALRHLMHDPQLPAELLPPGWPGDALRRAHARYDEAYRRVLRSFFRAHAGGGGTPTALG